MNAVLDMPECVYCGSHLALVERFHVEQDYRFPPRAKGTFVIYRCRCGGNSVLQTDENDITNFLEE